MKSVRSAPIPYLLALPEVKSAEGYPVLCFLHGYDEAAPTPLEAGLTRHGPLHPDNASRRAPFLVVAPQLPAAGDVWHRHADEVDAILTEVLAAHGGDPRRVYLTGFSFGANGVFDLAIANPARWAALWPVDPTRVPRVDPGIPVWLSLGQVSRPQRDHFIRALGLEPAADGIEEKRVWLDQGADHVGSARLAYGDDRIYAWLLRQTRE